MSNLIDRDALIAKLEITEGCLECKWVDGVYCKMSKTFADACEAIFGAPVIEQPEIVRCKDCKWYGRLGCAIRIVDDTDRPKEKDFCSFGESKDDG